VFIILEFDSIFERPLHPFTQQALLEAQQLGVAEADPSLDVNGWDTANKLVIIANAVCNFPCRIAECSVNGIAEVDPLEMKIAATQNKV
jgi:homoserine dehydrogenase